MISHILVFDAMYLAHAGAARTTINLCDYTRPLGNRFVGTSSCPGGVVPAGGARPLLIYTGASTNGSMFDVASVTAFESAAFQWSNLPGSSLEGSFDWSWSTSQSPLTPPAWADALCDQSNGVIPINWQDMIDIRGSYEAVLAVTAIYGDYNAPPSDQCNIVESDVWAVADLDSRPNMPTGWSGQAPSYLGPPVLIPPPPGVPGGPFSATQVMLHELGHAAGLDEDNSWAHPEVMRLMDVYYPEGGDPAGDGGTNDPLASVRVSTGEFGVMAAAGLWIPSHAYSNLLLYKWQVLTPGLASEVWTTPPPADEHWSACQCECLQFTSDAEQPRGPHPLQASANSDGTRTALVEWFLWDPTDAFQLANGCAAGLKMDNPYTPSPLIEGEQTISGMDAGEVFQVGRHTELCVPDTAQVGRSYKVCAVIRPHPLQGQATDDQFLSDSVVFSDAMFTVAPPGSCASGSGIQFLCVPPP